MRCAILQMKANLLVIYKNINIFTQKTLHPSFISKKKKFAFSIANVFGNIHLYHIFTILTVSEVCNISSK